MVVANNKIEKTKNAGKSTTISMDMAMQRYNVGCIARSGECLHRIAPTVAMVGEFK
jgi:hypothetical protein